MVKNFSRQNSSLRNKVMLLASFIGLGCGLHAQPSKSEKQAAKMVVERIAPQISSQLVFESIEKKDGCDVFEQEIRNGKLVIKGSSGVSLCRGFYDFMRNNEYGLVSWTGNRVILPSSITGSHTRRVESPFKHHYYFNVVTYGYTMPYWDWERWEKEIDWMAVHGFDMPLALVANEAISARVWKKLGLTDQEISDYFVGPAHLPWMRMGNVSGIDGPMPKEWHADQVKLQHQILKRMKSLGMKPICPGFAGFVPKAMKRLYPDVQIAETSWGGAFHNWMLSPEEELFHTIGKLFIQEWEKEFGKNQYYIVDSFNEMEIPFPPKEDPSRYSLLTSYGEKVYESIRSGNKDAVWVMQGWMFGYQRDIWDYKTLQALVSKVPDDKMLLLDLAVDYNTCFWKSQVNWEFYKGFYNKPWVYSVIPNMGGKSGMTGILSFYANGHLEALKSKNKGRLDGFGMAPEGIENNEVIYELLSDAGWSDKELDLEDWLANYSKCRYGSYPAEMNEFWENMLQSVYGSFTDHPRYNWQLRPGNLRKGSINANDSFYKGIEALSTKAHEMKGNELFEYDFREWAAAYLGGKLELLSQQIDEAYLVGDKTMAAELEALFVRWMKGMDVLLAKHPTKDLGKWIDLARGHAPGNDALADYYEKNARRIVTIWGPPVDDYSARIWSGLIRDYYLPRWQHYFEQKKSGVQFDFARWERNWVEETKGLSTVQLPSDLMGFAVNLIREASSVSFSNLYKGDVVGSWGPDDLKSDWTELKWVVPVDKVRQIKAVKVYQMKKGTAVKVSEIGLIGDGKKYSLSQQEKVVSETSLFPVALPGSFTGNNECLLTIKLLNVKSEESLGKIEIVY